MNIQVELRHIVYALSDALDLVGVDDVAHGKRVGIMAAECAAAMGLSETESHFLFDLGLLHDLGVSSTRTHQQLISEFDWDGAQEHAETGAELLAGFAPLADMAAPVRYHHTRWEQLSALGVDETVARQANLILLVDRVDALATTDSASQDALTGKEVIRKTIRERAGSYFSPELVEAFLFASRSEAFWLRLEARAIHAYLLDQLSRSPRCLMGLGELKQLSIIFSGIVDAKSPFTATHSLGVARLSRLLAERMGIGADNCEKLEIAGLLHDLGKLRVPDEILDKPTKLDPLERQAVNAHAFETYQILRNIPGFEEIARWAAYHHEKPDGSGYPFQITADAMTLEARILRVADIFQAMVQERPYRAGLNASQALRFLVDLKDQGQIDAAVVNCLGTHLDDAMRAARPGGPDAGLTVYGIQPTSKKITAPAALRDRNASSGSEPELS